MRLIDDGEVLARTSVPNEDFFRAAETALIGLSPSGSVNASEVYLSTKSTTDLLDWLDETLNNDRNEHLGDPERNYDVEYWIFVDQEKENVLFFYVRLSSADPSSDEGSIFYGWQVTRVAELGFVVQPVDE